MNQLSLNTNLMINLILKIEILKLFVANHLLNGYYQYQLNKQKIHINLQVSQSKIKKKKMIFN